MPVITSLPAGRREAGTLVSLYSGAGGLDLGFQRAGFTPIWANDIDPVVVETYNKAIRGHVAHAGDLVELLDVLPKRGSVDMVVGGPPCQGFSVAGKMNPDDERSRHVFNFVSVVSRLKPRAFAMENVKALAMNRRWRRLIDELRAEAESEGYHTQVIVLNASHYGVPQARERMFMIGTQSLPRGELRPQPVSEHDPPTVRDALDRLPKLGTVGNNSASTARITPAKNPVLRRSPFAGMLFNGQGRPLDLDRPAPTLPASMGGNRTPIVDQHQYESGGDSWVISYHDHLSSGGKPYRAVPDRLRRLTVEEAAELQTFPQGMHWAGSLSAQFRQIGNAVPPVLAYHVARAISDEIGIA